METRENLQHEGNKSLWKAKTLRFIHINPSDQASGIFGSSLKRCHEGYKKKYGSQHWENEVFQPQQGRGTWEVTAIIITCARMCKLPQDSIPLSMKEGAHKLYN